MHHLKKALRIAGEQLQKKGLKEVKAWQKKLHDGGWACLHWPKQYGGRESTPIERVIWGQEVSKFKVPEATLK